jgi:hypothetical protein
LVDGVRTAQVRWRVVLKVGGGGEVGISENGDRDIGTRMCESAMAVVEVVKVLLSM